VGFWPNVPDAWGSCAVMTDLLGGSGNVPALALGTGPA
jgi:hypothetical protein